MKSRGFSIFIFCMSIIIIVLAIASMIFDIQYLKDNVIWLFLIGFIILLIDRGLKSR